MSHDSWEFAQITIMIYKHDVAGKLIFTYQMNTNKLSHGGKRIHRREQAIGNQLQNIVSKV